MNGTENLNQAKMGLFWKGCFPLYLLFVFNLMCSLAQLLCGCVMSQHKRSAADWSWIQFLCLWAWLCYILATLALCAHWDTTENNLWCSAWVECPFLKWPYAADGWEWCWSYRKTISQKISLCSAALWYRVCQRPHTWRGNPLGAFVKKFSVWCHMKGGDKRPDGTCGNALGGEMSFQPTEAALKHARFLLRVFSGFLDGILQRQVSWIDNSVRSAHC